MQTKALLDKELMMTFFAHPTKPTEKVSNPVYAVMKSTHEDGGACGCAVLWFPSRARSERLDGG